MYQSVKSLLDSITLLIPRAVYKALTEPDVRRRRSMKPWDIVMWGRGPHQHTGPLLICVIPFNHVVWVWLLHAWQNDPPGYFVIECVHCWNDVLLFDSCHVCWNRLFLFPALLFSTQSMRAMGTIVYFLNITSLYTMKTPTNTPRHQRESNSTPISRRTLRLRPTSTRYCSRSKPHIRKSIVERRISILNSVIAFETAYTQIHGWTTDYYFD